MTTPVVVPVDVEDDRALSSWFSVLQAAAAVDHPWGGEPVLPEVRHEARTGAGRETTSFWRASLGGDDVGALRLVRPHAAGGTSAELVLAVHPAARRRGIGTALLEQAVAAARGHGCDRLVAGVAEPVDAATKPPGERPASAGAAFARAAGFTLQRCDVRTDLDLPLDEDHLVDLEVEARPHADGYRVVTWRDGVPSALLDARAALSARLTLDAPGGTAEVWDGERVRAREERVLARGRRTWGAGALHEATGELVGYAEVSAHDADPDQAWLEESAVEPSHRGRRLGVLLAVADLRALATHRPGTRRVSAWTAEDDAPRTAVQEALGTRAVALRGVWQRPL